MSSSELDLIQKMWFGTSEEALEAVQAAATLGFGVSLRNESIVDDEEPTAIGEQWIVEIYNEVPTADPEPAAAD